MPQKRRRDDSLLLFWNLLIPLPGLRFFPKKSYPAIQRARIYGKTDWRFGGKLCAGARASLYWRMILRETGCRWKLCLWAAVLVRACPWLRPGVKSCAGHSTVGIRLPKNISLRIAARAGRCAEKIKREGNRPLPSFGALHKQQAHNVHSSDINKLQPLFWLGYCYKSS